MQYQWVILGFKHFEIEKKKRLMYGGDNSVSTDDRDHLI